MSGIPREVTEHELSIRPSSKPVRQPLRCCDKNKQPIITEEITTVLAAGFIKEVCYPEWLANPVLVKKKERGMANVC